MMSALLRVCCSVYILSTTAFGNMDTLQSSAAATPALPMPGFGSATFDSSLTDQARIYAGMMPLNPLHYSTLPRQRPGSSIAKYSRRTGLN